MSDIKNKKWDVFFLDELFTIKSSAHQIDKVNIKNNGAKKYPYVTRSNIDNGVSDFISYQNVEPNDGNVITIGLDTQTVFYQSSKFYTGQNIQILDRNNLNRSIALFLIPLLEKQMKKFNWGGNGATLTRLKRLSIILPVDDRGMPDWGYMEQYIKSKTEHLNSTVSLLEKHDIYDYRKLNDIKWGNFVIGKLFNIRIGKNIDGNKVDKMSGHIPYVTRRETDNGIDGFLSNNFNEAYLNKIKNYCITIGNETATPFVQQYDFYTGTKVNILEPINHQLDLYAMQFLQVCIKNQMGRFSYSYAATSKRLKKQIISIPLNSNGSPDYEFMSQYMKRQENKIIGQMKKEAGR
ncbi:restriction endonuclease subunit S [Vagococcus lutrae]|uniref:restriction endonuclease subunit S n=1 Tax=Vagococcus lutrae TaxID=81947 RepID=UPI00288DDF68|nr:restriction endonuclease subunit S [Vagococcus lutrae]MDT2841895.1 restriction endonuclease subunit S [Vagococcus lutrae]